MNKLFISKTRGCDYSVARVSCLLTFCEEITGGDGQLEAELPQACVDTCDQHSVPLRSSLIAYTRTAMGISSPIADDADGNLRPLSLSQHYSRYSISLS